MISAQHTLLHLSLIPDIGPITISKILAKLTEDRLHEVYTFTTTDFINYGQISQHYAEKLVAGLRDTKLLEQELLLIEKYNITIITIIEDVYPPLLKEIYAAPIVLYIRGDLQILQGYNLAMVGSRQANSYGQQIINFLIPELIQQNWQLVSGGALGADTMVHQAALDNKGTTLAVLGSGLLQPYPLRNKKLFENIIEMGGALVSSFALSTLALPGNFPARNRIIAGLSYGCVVVQAARQSGACITAQFALEQGKEVFAVPGHITDSLSEGCHLLIQQGAQLVTSSTDIMNELQHVKLTTLELQKAVVVSEKIEKNDHLTQEHHLIKLCKKQSFTTDELIAISGIDLINIQTELFNLQLEGKIKQNIAGIWQVI